MLHEYEFDCADLDEGLPCIEDKSHIDARRMGVHLDFAAKKGTVRERFGSEELPDEPQQYLKFSKPSKSTSMPVEPTIFDGPLKPKGTFDPSDELTMAKKPEFKLTVLTMNEKQLQRLRKKQLQRVQRAYRKAS